MSLKKHIPNTITSLNLLCGVIGIIFTLEGKDPQLPFIFMLAAVTFDFCDGLAARLLGAYSPVGKELDSLSDVVSFGVLPAIMMYRCIGSLPLSLIALPIAVFSALRLANFNLDERQHESFIGLPTPASALVCGSLCCLAEQSAWLCNNAFWIVPAVSLLLCALLVCRIPMFSFKFGKNIKADTLTRMLRIGIISIAAIIILLVIAFRLPWPAAILGILLAYIIENVLVFGILTPGK